MSLDLTPRPEWLTFDCYGTLIQWDEGLMRAVERILQTKGAATVEPAQLIRIYDAHEHALEQAAPHRSFRQVAGEALRLALDELNVEGAQEDDMGSICFPCQN